jgi:hypothetical protein
MSKAKELAERLRSCGEFTRIGAAHDAVALLLSQENRIAELEKALEPFAEIVRDIETEIESHLTDEHDDAEIEIKLKFCRRARSALTPSSPGEEG